MAVTLKQIAVASGVSRPAVSLILNDKADHLRPQTRQRVRDMAQQMGYRPNAFARAVRAGRFRNIGLLMGAHYERSNLTREMIRGMHDALRDKGMHLTISFLDDEQLNSEDQLPALLEEQMVDGLLINYTHAIPDHMSEAIAYARLPVIWVNVKRPAMCVYPDDFRAGGDAARHLLGLGHRRIAFGDFVHGPDNPFAAHYSAEDRWRGFEQAMTTAGLKPLRVQVRQMLVGNEAIDLATSVLEADEAPSAVVCQSSRDAAVFHASAVGLRRRVPHDLSLITFGSERLIDSVFDTTRFVEPREEMGVVAARQLLALIDVPAQLSPPAKVPYQLHGGQTTRAVQ